MERDQAKRILLFCRDIDGEIRHNKSILRDYEDTYYISGGGSALDSMPKGKYKTSSPTENTALNIPDSASAAMRNLRAEIERLAALKAEILGELNGLALPQKTILYDFYIKGLQWVQISVRVHYSGTQCKQIRNRALENLASRFAQNDFIKNFNYPS